MVVPVGKDNHAEIVEVVEVAYFSAEQAPIPPEQVKWIIRKCTADDFQLGEPESSVLGRERETGSVEK